MRLKSWTMAAAAPLMGLAVATAAQADGTNDHYSPAPVAAAKSTVTFSGSDWARDASYFYSGVLLALNRDLGQDGFVLRGFAGVPMYEYDAAAVPGGVVDGDGIQGDLMIGYMWHREHFTFIGYAGVDYQDFDLTPNDPSSKVNGSEVGFKVAGDLTSAYGSPFYWNLHGSYSTAFETYWTRARVGYNAGRFVVGPEFVAMGSEGFDAQRVGGFVSVRIELSPAISSEISAHVGHQFVNDDGQNGSSGGEGTYGGVGFSLVF